VPAVATARVPAVAPVSARAQGWVRAPDWATAPDQSGGDSAAVPARDAADPVVMVADLVEAAQSPASR
jgi:hypothetical protein